MLILSTSTSLIETFGAVSVAEPMLKPVLSAARLLIVPVAPGNNDDVSMIDVAATDTCVPS